MRGDERTETSRTRHHLQGGVSAVSRGQPHSSRPARKPRRDEATAELENRTATGVSSGADRVDSSWRGENGARPRHPPDPLTHPATPPRYQTPRHKALSKPSHQQQLRLRGWRGDFGACFGHEHIDLAAHPEPAGQVNPRLHREADAGHERALVGGLEVVDVRARAMQVAIDRVPGTVHEVLAVSGLAHHGACRIVHLRTGENRSPFPLPRPLPALPEYGNRGITRRPHRIPDLADLRIGRAPREAHPRLVGEHGPEGGAAPQVEQQHLARLQPQIRPSVRLVVRHRGVGCERCDRRVVGHEPGAPDPLDHALLQRDLAHFGAARRLPSRPGEGIARDLGQRTRRAPVPFRLRGAPARRGARPERRAGPRARREVGPAGQGGRGARGGHQRCRGSGGAARHSQRSPPVARHVVWSIAPSKPTSKRSSSAKPVPYRAQAAPSGVAFTAIKSPTRATGTPLSRRSSPPNTARAARRATPYPSSRGAARAATRDATNSRRTARRAARRPASANTRSASGRRPTSRSRASTCAGSARASRRTIASYWASCMATVCERPSRLESSSSANSDRPSSTGVSRLRTASRTARGTMLWTTAGVT